MSQRLCDKKNRTWDGERYAVELCILMRDHPGDCQWAPDPISTAALYEGDSREV